MPITRCNSAGFQILLGLALLAATVAMLSPRVPDAGISFDHFDKLVHASTFLVLAFLADAGWPQHGFGRAKYLPLLGYGILIECVQYFIPNRSFDLLDVAADATGLLLYGAMLLTLLRRLQVR